MLILFVRKSFIFDNLLFYSALLFEFVSRACRFNLSSVKDAHLLFRVIKVLRFVENVNYIECCLFKSSQLSFSS